MKELVLNVTEFVRSVTQKMFQYVLFAPKHSGYIKINVLQVARSEHGRTKTILGVMLVKLLSVQFVEMMDKHAKNVRNHS